MTVQTAFKSSTCSGNPKSFTCKNTRWRQKNFSLQCKTVRKRHTVQLNSWQHRPAWITCSSFVREVLFLMTISWQGQVNITKVLMMYSFCLVSSIKHIPNFSLLPMPTEISTYSSQPDWLHQAALKEHLQLIFVPVLLKSLFYRNECLKEHRSSCVDFSKISCPKKIRKIAFKKTTADLKTKQHVSESREKAF